MFELVYGGITSSFQQHLQLKTGDKSAGICRDLKQQEVKFEPWQCISLVRINGTTLDFTVDDTVEAMSMIHVCYRLIKKLSERCVFMPTFLNMRVKMKIGYQCWKDNIVFKDMVK